MTIARKSDQPLTAADATFTIGCNITLKGSKQMNADEQDRLVTFGTIRLIITDATDPENKLFDDILEATEFKTGSVGYKVHRQGLVFTKQDA